MMMMIISLHIQLEFDFLSFGTKTSLKMCGSPPIPEHANIVAMETL